jgi:hypothetical protein
MHRRLATSALAVMALASAGAFGAAHAVVRGSCVSPSGAAESGRDPQAMTSATCPRLGRGSVTTYNYLDREGPGARGQAGWPKPAPSPKERPQAVPAATSYAVVPGSASLERASAIPAATALLASALGGVGRLVWRQLP